MKKVAYLLCGGKGNRLKPLTNYVQKCMIPIGLRQAPVLDYIVRLLVKHGVKSIYMVSGHMHQQIENYFGNGRRLGARIQHVVDKPSYWGSLPGLKDAVVKTRLGNDDRAVVWMGDVLAQIPVKSLLESMDRMASDALFVSDGNYKIRVGLFRNGIKEDATKRITYEEKPITNYAHVGIGFFKGHAIKHVKDWENFSDYSGYNKDFIPYIVNTLHSEVKTDVFIMSGTQAKWWMDVGQINRFDELKDADLDEMMGLNDEL